MVMLNARWPTERSRLASNPHEPGISRGLSPG
jgi:hypothetical protein